MSPRPLWSITLPERKVLYPQFEQENGPYLLAVEYQFGQVAGNVHILGLVILDKQTGRELYRLSTSDPNILRRGETLFVPRIHDDVVWWPAMEKSGNGIGYVLYSWRFKEDNKQKAVHTWHYPGAFSHGIAWPIKSKILFVRYNWSQRFLQIIYPTNPFLSYALEYFANSLSVELPAWYEAWQLPDHPDQPLKMLSQWPVPKNRLHAHWQFSDDGKRAVVTESWGDERVAEKRAIAKGRKVFEGDELFNLFRPDSQGLLLYDTTTGKCIQHYRDKTAHLKCVSWQGPHIITFSLATEPHIQLTLNEIHQGAANRNKNLFSNSFYSQYSIFKVDDQGFQRVPFSEELHNTNMKLYVSGNELSGESYEEHPEKTHYHFAIQDGQLINLCTIVLPYSTTISFHNWLPGSYQYLLLTRSPWVKRLELLEGKWAILNNLVARVKPTIAKAMYTTMVDDQPGNRREHTFDMRPVTGAPGALSKLYMEKFHSLDRIVSEGSLYCFELPLHLHSPWWGRTAAMLPWFWLAWVIVRRSFFTRSGNH
ncbi:MAG: hypothetical protein JNJ77_01580 [Planctomycetia bacterium]|nr:hypothetical protein [Planctomycetia bacterium]